MDDAKIADEIRDAAGAGPSPQEKILAEAAQSLAKRFGEVVKDARALKPQAVAKMKHFAAALEADPEEGQAIGVRLATMNRAQRRIFLSDLRRAKRKQKKA